MIELSRVTKRYQDRVALAPLDLCLKGGERVVLFGPSGCGKTTALRIIAGLVAPDGGHVIFDGRVASEAGRVHVPPERRQLGYVFQDLALWPHMTVAENIEFVLKARGVPKAHHREQVAELLSLVELPTRSEDRPANLSGGEQQRVAIARALAGSPVAILMDEPMANLDDDLRRTLCGVVRNLQQKLGFGLVAVTHRSDEIGMLDARRIEVAPL